MEYRSPSQIWRDSGAEITSLPFMLWMSNERIEFQSETQGGEFDFLAWMNNKYDELERQMIEAGERQAAGSEMDAPVVSGIQVDFDQSKLYDAYPADGVKFSADNKPSPKTILGLSPAAFASVAGAIGLTLVLIVVTLARGGKPATK